MSDGKDKVRDLADAAESIADVCARLAGLDMASANGGNVSVRLSETSVLITPSGACLGDVGSNDLVTVNMQGEKLSGQGEPSIETKSHVAFYTERPDVHAVIHCHPPCALAWALAGKLPPIESFCEVYFLVREVYLVHPYRTPFEQPPLVKEHARHANGFLLSNHGLLMAGPDLRTAMMRVETYELLCRAALEAARIGGATRIPPRELSWLDKGHHEHYPR